MTSRATSSSSEPSTRPLPAAITAETIYGPYSNAGQVALAFGAGLHAPPPRHRRVQRASARAAPPCGASRRQKSRETPQPLRPSRLPARPPRPAPLPSTWTTSATPSPWPRVKRRPISVPRLPRRSRPTPTAPARRQAPAPYPLTAKSKGPWGNSIPVAVQHPGRRRATRGRHLRRRPRSPVEPASPSIANALNALGTGTNAEHPPQRPVDDRPRARLPCHGHRHGDHRAGSDDDDGDRRPTTALPRQPSDGLLRPPRGQALPLHQRRHDELAPAFPPRSSPFAGRRTPTTAPTPCSASPVAARTPARSRRWPRA